MADSDEHQPIPRLGLASDEDIVNATTSQVSGNVAITLPEATETITGGSQDLKTTMTGTSSGLVISRKSVQLKAGRTLEVFHLFPKLAPELRVKILAEALAALEPRIIELLWATERGLCTDCPILVFLHVSSESRIEALKVYKKFRTTCSALRSKTGEVQEPYIYINYDRDMLFLSLRYSTDRNYYTDLDRQIGSRLQEFKNLSHMSIKRYVPQLLLHSGREQVRHIAISVSLRHMTTMLCYTDAIVNFSNLKTCALAMDIDDCCHLAIGYTVWDPKSPVELYGITSAAYPIRAVQAFHQYHRYYVTEVKDRMIKRGMASTLVDNINIDKVQIHRRVVGS